MMKMHDFSCLIFIKVLNTEYIFEKNYLDINLIFILIIK